jgi:hypothetical protein
MKELDEIELEHNQNKYVRIRKPAFKYFLLILALAAYGAGSLLCDILF